MRTKTGNIKYWSPVGFSSDDIEDINWVRVWSIKGAAPVPIGREGVTSGGAHFQGPELGLLLVCISYPLALFKKILSQNLC